MAMSKLEWVSRGINFFLSGEVFNPSNMENHSWQCTAFTSGYNFAYNLFLDDSTSLDDKFSLFEVLLNESSTDTIKRTWLKWEVKIQYKEHECTIIIPFKNYKQLFLGSFHKINNETTAFKLKVLKGLEDLNFKVLDCTLIKPDDIKL